jgi:hypothetical protein
LDEDYDITVRAPPSLSLFRSLFRPLFNMPSLAVMKDTSKGAEEEDDRTENYKLGNRMSID